MIYRYIKTINNNAIVASDKNKHEVIIMGKAIGVKCNRTLGTRIDNELIERVFVSNNNQNYVEAIIEQIPYNMFKVVELVIKQAEQDLNTKFKDAIYLALVDHIYFSYKTIKEGGKIENPLLNEIKLFHPSEFIAAMNSINTINHYLNADFDQQEASYIAFHYINALSNLSTTEQKSIMKDLEATLNFIDDLTSNSLNKSSYQYGRLIIHLKCLFGRLIGDDRTEGERDLLFEMSENLKNEYSKEWEYARKISDFIQNNLKYDISSNEVTYLTLHISPMLKDATDK